MKRKRRSFLVSLNIPTGCSISEIKSYILESVQFACGGLDSSSALFELDKTSVKVKQFTTKTKEWKKINV